MYELHERRAAAGATQGVDVARPGEATRQGYSLVRRWAFLLLMLGGLAGALAVQTRLSIYAASGGGAAHVSVPPGSVALLLLLCLGSAFLLSWRDLRAGMQALQRASAASEPGQPRWYRHAWLPAIVHLRANWHAALSGIHWPKFWRDWLWMLSLLLALVASLVADLGAGTPAGRPAAQWWWVGSVVALVVAAAAWDSRRRSQMPMSKPAHAVQPAALRSFFSVLWADVGDLALLAVLLVGALWLRLPGLVNQPYVVHGDEAACGMEALRWLHGGVPSLISVGWYGLPMAGYGLPALVMRVAGANLFGLRLSSVLIGVLSIALLYALAREFAGRRMAFVAAASMTLAHVHIHFSRMGIHYIHAPFAVLLTLWLLVRALRTQRALPAVLAGVGLSLSAQVYFSARIVFVIVPLFLIGLLVFHRAWLNGRALVPGWAALSLLVSCGPLGVFFLKNPDPLKERSAEVLILNLTPAMRAHLSSQFGSADLSTVLMRQLAAVPLLVGGLADQSLQYGPLYPLFDALMAVLVTVGFFYALLHLTRPLCLLLVIWVACTVVLGGVLTIDMPWWPRLLVMVPALCLLAALALEEVLRAVQRAWASLEWALLPMTPGRRLRALMLGWLLALAVLGYTGGQSYQHYFVEYPQTVNSNSWRTQYTTIGRYLAELPAGTDVILFSDDGLIWDYPTFQFLAPHVHGQQVDSSQALQAALSSRAGPVLMIITPRKASDFQRLLSMPGRVPAGRYLIHTDAQGQIAFFTYSIGTR